MRIKIFFYCILKHIAMLDAHTIPKGLSVHIERFCHSHAAVHPAGAANANDELALAFLSYCGNKKSMVLK